VSTSLPAAKCLWLMCPGASTWVPVWHSILSSDRLYSDPLAMDTLSRTRGPAVAPGANAGMSGTYACVMSRMRRPPPRSSGRSASAATESSSPQEPWSAYPGCAPPASKAPAPERTAKRRRRAASGAACVAVMVPCGARDPGIWRQELRNGGSLEWRVDGYHTVLLSLSTASRGLPATCKCNATRCAILFVHPIQSLNVFFKKEKGLLILLRISCTNDL
jgi:hypothetical protein